MLHGGKSNIIIIAFFCDVFSFNMYANSWHFGFSRNLSIIPNQIFIHMQVHFGMRVWGLRLTVKYPTGCCWCAKQRRQTAAKKTQNHQQRTNAFSRYTYIFKHAHINIRLLTKLKALARGQTYPPCEAWEA